MKKLFPFLIVITILSCKKEHVNEYIGPPADTTQEHHTAITYPDSVFVGNNVLAYTNNTTLFETVNYELGAELEADAQLKIVITNYPLTDSAGNDITYWQYSSPVGFTVSDFDTLTNSQTLISNASGKIYMPINFIASGQNGNCRIDYYENGTAITRTRYFPWH